MSTINGLKEAADQIAKSLSHSRMRGHSAFVSTPLLYPNGTSVLVRIDERPNGFDVSDDGYGALTAETMGGLHTYNRVAANVAARLGIRFEERTFFAFVEEYDRLLSAVAAVANATARAADRTAQSLEQLRVRKTRDIFDERLRSAFGHNVSFDVTIRGGTGRTWDYDAAVGGVGADRLFTFVGPAFAAVATANIKIMDTLAVPSPPTVTTVLADYNRTEPALRSILSDTGSFVIGASDEPERYRLSG